MKKEMKKEMKKGKSIYIHFPARTITQKLALNIADYFLSKYEMKRTRTLWKLYITFARYGNKHRFVQIRTEEEEDVK